MSFEPSSPAAAPSVSVIVPFRDVENFLGDCIESVLDQSLEGLELVLVDDASEDGSLAMAEGYARQDGRVRIVSHPRALGTGPARNIGVALAAGHHLLFLDSDDRLASPQALTHLLDRAAHTRLPVVIGSCERLLPNGNLRPYDRDMDVTNHGHPDSRIGGLQALKAAFCLPGQGYVPVRAWGTLIDSAWFRSTGLVFPANPSEDLAMMPFLYGRAEAVYYDAAITVHYRQRPDSKTEQPLSIHELLGYQSLWRELRQALEREGLAMMGPDLSLKIADTLLYWVDNSGLEPSAYDQSTLALRSILSLASTSLNGLLVRDVLVRLCRCPGGAGLRRQWIEAIVSLLPSKLLLEHIGQRLAAWEAGDTSNEAEETLTYCQMLMALRSRECRPASAII